MLNKIFKNILLSVGVMLITPTVVFSGLVTMEMNTDFSSVEPAEHIQLKLLKDAFLYDNEFFVSNTIIDCDILNVTEPKRLKRSASFECKPTTYARSSEELKTFDVDLKIKFARILNKKNMAKGLATTVVSTAANRFVPGLGIGVGAVTKAIEAKESRFKAAVHGAYESTPLSYIEKGPVLDLEAGDVILVKINKVKKNKNK